MGHEEANLVKENSDSKIKYTEDDIIKMLGFLIDNIFVVFFFGKGFPTDSRYSNGNQICPSSSHFSLLIWSRIYTVFVLNRKETVGILVQFHI